MEMRISHDEQDVTITGTCSEVQQTIENTDQALGHMFLGIIMALHFGKDGQMAADLGDEYNSPNDRPVEFVASLANNGTPQNLSCRFLDEEPQS